MEALVYFLLWAGLIFLMMRFGCGAHVTGRGRRHEGSTAQSPPGSESRFTSPQANVDPVCGMTVDLAKANSSVFGGRAYYFCSASCREKFEANPQAFVQESGSRPHPMEHAHGPRH